MTQPGLHRGRVQARHGKDAKKVCVGSSAVIPELLWIGAEAILKWAPSPQSALDVSSTLLLYLPRWLQVAGAFPAPCEHPASTGTGWCGQQTDQSRVQWDHVEEIRGYWMEQGSTEQ